VTAPAARPAAPPAGKPVLLDAYCGAGGAARGYQMAGFYVIGVDIAPQPRYAGDEFHRGDAIEFIRRHGRAFDAIHASPPCQAYTAMRRLGKRAGEGAPDLVAATRAALARAGRPWVIENVVGAPLRHPLKVCGSSFGLGVRRHRLFESSEFLLGRRCQHRQQPHPIGVYGDHPQQPGDRTYRVNRARTLAEGQAAMGIDWMLWAELTQAIPPAFCEHVGAQLLRALRKAA
jgi:DNA (cytosine-5)-methyltransferase 1